MKKFFSGIVAVLMLFNMSFAAFETFDTEKLDLFKQMIQELYYTDVSEKEIMEGAIKGMFRSLDKYSAYYNEDETVTLKESISGNYCGVGIKIESIDGYANIMKVFKDTPAQKAGLEVKDYVIKINGEDIKGWSLDKVASYIRGEEGTEVEVTILRGNTTFTKKLKRENVQVESCSFDVLQDNIGYIYIEDFTLTTSKEFDEILRIFDIVGIKKIILDLRDNPGGYLDQCVEVAKRLVPKGVITTIKYKSSQDNVYKSTLKETKYELVVLVNGGTASAAEIIAGAVKDTKAGTVVGEQTYGKGVVQQLLNIIGGGSIKITTGRYFTPNDICIDGVGIEPNVVVEGKEVQLRKAIELLK